MRCTMRSLCEAVANVIKTRAVPVIHVMYKLKFKTSFYTFFFFLDIILSIYSFIKHLFSVLTSQTRDAGFDSRLG